MSYEHVDVLIVGGGLSGIGAACHLRRNSPDKSYAILEARDAIGGTWDLFRYPGIRSDSDMYTLGYSFKPWTHPKAIADGESIRDYIRQTAREHGVIDRVRLHHRVVAAEWSSEQARWTVEVERTDTAETIHLTCDFLYCCTGYYRYDEGYTPEFPGIERFDGTVVHPQHWPEDLDYAGKRVVVIGSGATAVTLVPAMAETAGHVTMLQRSPSYVLTLPGRDPVADLMRRVLPESVVYPVTRWKNVALATLLFKASRRTPGLMRRLLIATVRRQLPEGYDVATHFNPRYAPWDQRMCFVPDGDLFAALSSGKASIVTDRIASFTEQGIELESGEQLAADIVITATGLNLLALGGMRLTVDGRDIELRRTVAYKGMMLSGVPNFAWTLGYTNASWTLKADLVAQHVCRLLNHMTERNLAVVVPREPDTDERDPIIDLQAGYVLRSLAELPKQGPAAPWRLRQSYPRDLVSLRHGPVADKGLLFRPAPRREPAAPSAA